MFMEIVFYVLFRNLTVVHFYLFIGKSWKLVLEESKNLWRLQDDVKNYINFIVLTAEVNKKWQKFYAH